MRSYIERRVEDEARYIIEHEATVRDCARAFSVSKSTVHKDMTGRLPAISGSLSAQVRAVFERNLDERHLRGGEATREKYLKQRGFCGGCEDCKCGGNVKCSQV